MRSHDHRLHRIMARLGAIFMVSGSLTLIAQPASARDLVAFASAPAGAIVIRNHERALYFTLGGGRAIRYPIAIGRQAKQWVGSTVVERKVPFPVWQPPAVVRADSPNLPALVPPGPKNPLGTRALVLGRAEYAIHGTNAPQSIGREASYGCIRMFNPDVEDLFQRVSVGTPVYVVN
ncbi:L,D-transpeptidase [Candidatus Raskinella chloraquaticus]